MAEQMLTSAMTSRDLGGSRSRPQYL